jgi:hypothetical protein
MSANTTIYCCIALRLAKLSQWDYLPVTPFYQEETWQGEIYHGIVGLSLSDSV